MSNDNGQQQETAPGMPTPDRRNQLAKELATSHAKWWKEFGSTYMFYFSNLTGLSGEAAFQASTLLWLFEMKGELRSELQTMRAGQGQGLEMMGVLLQGFMGAEGQEGGEGAATG